MTAYCVSSSNRTRPSTFMFAMMGGEPMPEQPVSPTHSIDTPDEEPIEQPNPGDPGPPVLRPSKKRVPDEDGSF